MPDNIRLAIVDGHPLVREGLVHVTESVGGFEVAAMGETAQDAVTIVATIEPDILILDLAIAGTGHQALRDIQGLGRRTRVLVLTASENEADVMEALRCGASGYALKVIGGTALRRMLQSIHLGESYVAPSLAARILSSISQSIATPRKIEDNGLSKREASIYSLIKMGYCNKEIGRSLQLSEKTIKHYLTNVYRKLGVSNRLELALLGSGPAGRIEVAAKV